MTPTPEAGKEDGGAGLPFEHCLPTYRALNMLAPPSWRFLLALSALKHGVLQREVLGRSRQVHIVAARYEAMALTYQHTQASMPKVGRHFNRDHTTVLHGLRKRGAVQKLVEKYVPEDTPQAPRLPKSVPDIKGGAPAGAKPKPRTALQRAVKRAYDHNISPAAVAEGYGCNPKSVKVIAFHMGLKRRPDYRPKSKHGAAEPSNLSKGSKTLAEWVGRQ